MKQELISAFLLKNATKLNIEEKVELQKQLQTRDNRLFNLLILHNKPNPTLLGYVRLFLIIWSIVAPIVSICCFVVYLCTDIENFLVTSSWCGISILCSLLPLSTNRLKLASRKKRLYNDYLKIIQSHK